MRPDVGEATRELAETLADTFDQPNDPAWLHGDAHLKNVVVTRQGIALVDLDQAATGPAAADLGGVLSRLRHMRLVGAISASRERALIGCLLRGYSSLREPPDGRSIAWHLAASLLGERALRAVTRVRLEGLGHLGELIERPARRAGSRRRRAPRALPFPSYPPGEAADRHSSFIASTPSASGTSPVRSPWRARCHSGSTSWS